MDLADGTGHDPELSWETITSPSSGTLSGEGRFPIYRPHPNYHGTDGFRFRVRLGQTEAVAGVEITVEPVDDRPVVHDATVEVAEDGATEFQLAADDADGDLLAFALSRGPQFGEAALNGARVAYRPAPDFHGQDSVEWTVDDGNGPIPGITRIQVLSRADPLEDRTIETTVSEDRVLIYQLPATDPDGNTLTWTLAADAASGTAIISNTEVRYAPEPNYHGADSFIARGVAADVAATYSFGVQVTPVNDAPTLADLSIVTLQGQTAEAPWDAEDVDGDPVEIVVLEQPRGGELVAGTNLRFAPHPGFTGHTSGRIVATDGTLDSAPANVEIQVSPVPDGTSESRIRVAGDEDQRIDIALPSGEYAVVRAATFGDVSIQGAAAVYTPFPDRHGLDHFTVGVGGVPLISVEVTVQPVNDAPVVGAQEIAPLSQGSWGSRQVVARDADGDPVVFVFTDLPPGIAGTQTGRVEGVATESGTFPVQFVVSDGAAQTTGLFDLIVEATNRPPVPQQPGVISATANAQLTVSLAASDPDGDGLTWSTVSAPMGVAIDGSRLVWTPTNAQAGLHEIELEVADGTHGVALTIVIDVVSPARSSGSCSTHGQPEVSSSWIPRLAWVVVGPRRGALPSLIACQSDPTGPAVPVRRREQHAVIGDGTWARSWSLPDDDSNLPAAGPSAAAHSNGFAAIVANAGQPDGSFSFYWTTDDLYLPRDALPDDFNAPVAGHQNTFVSCAAGTSFTFAPFSRLRLWQAVPGLAASDCLLGGGGHLVLIAPDDDSDTMEVWHTRRGSWAHADDVEAAPPARRGAALVDDGGGIYGQILIGGVDADGNYLDDVWRWTRSDTWEEIEIQGPRPLPRAGHAAAVVPGQPRGSAVVIGGETAPGELAANPLWLLDYEEGTWTQLQPEGADLAQRVNHDVITLEDRIQIHGGTRGGANAAALVHWTWPDGNLTGVGQRQLPAPRTEHKMAVDPDGGYLLFGGRAVQDALGDTWTWGDGWTQLAPDPAPSPRWGHGLVHVPDSNEVILLGGANPDGPLSDMWRFDGNAWSQLTPPPPNPPAGEITLTWDGERVVAVAATGTWTWDGDRWSRQSGPLPAWDLAGFIVGDPRHGRTLAATPSGFGPWNWHVFGGLAWTELEEEGTPLTATRYAGSYDRSRRRTVVLSLDGQRVVRVSAMTGADLDDVSTSGPVPASFGTVLPATEGLAVFTTDFSELWTLELANSAPRLDPIPDRSVETDRAVRVAVSAHDPDADPLELSFTGPLGASLEGMTLFWTPTVDDVGRHSITIRASDGEAVTAETFAIDVGRPFNQPPNVRPVVANLTEDSPGEVTLLGSDPEGLPVTYTILSGPRSGSAGLAGATVSYSPNADFFGEDSFTYVAHDDETTSLPGLALIHVAPRPDAPQAHDHTLSVLEDHAQSLRLSGSDVDLEPLEWRVTTMPAHGRVRLVGNTATYEPNINFVGADVFGFVVTDGQLTTGEYFVRIQVASSPDAPVALDAVATTLEDTAVEISLTGFDPDGDDLTFTVSRSPRHGAVAVDGSRALYTPSANHHGVDDFLFVASDGRSTSPPATAAIEVVPVNDEPLALPVAGSTSGGRAVIPLICSDADGDRLTYQVATQPSAGDAQIVGDQLVYAAGRGAEGADVFSYACSDGQTTSPPARVHIDLPAGAGVELLPDSSAITQEDESVLISVTPPPGYRLEIVTQPRGDAAVTESGIEYEPLPDDHGTDRFAILARGHIGVTNLAWVTVVVEPVPDVPVAHAVVLHLREDTEASATLRASDADGDSLQWRLVEPPQDGQARVSEGRLTYTPAPNWSGGTRAVVAADDGTGLSATAIVEIRVAAQPDAPVIALVQPIKGQSGDVVLARVSVEDPDGDAIAVRAEGLPPGVEVAGRALRGVLPTVSAPTSWSARLIASDGAFESTAPVTFVVTPRPAPTVFEPLAKVTAQVGTRLEVPVRAWNGRDPAVVEWGGTPTGASFDGSTLTWHPVATDIGVHLVTFQAGDVSADLTIEVHPVVASAAAKDGGCSVASDSHALPSPFGWALALLLLIPLRRKTALSFGTLVLAIAIATPTAAQDFTVRDASVLMPQAGPLGALAFDSGRDRLVFFGGLDAGGTPMDELWEFDGNNWLRIATQDPWPEPLSGYAAYDPVGQRTLVLGRGSSSRDPAYLWAWDGDDWELLWQSDDDEPQFRATAPLRYDMDTGRVIVSGAQVWEWDRDAGWIAGAGPTHARAVFDPEREAVVYLRRNNSTSGATARGSFWMTACTPISRTCPVAASS